MSNLEPIIDPHQHLWDLSLFHLPWIRAESPLAGNHLMSDYLREAEGLGIEKTVYMEVDLDPAQQGEEADYVVGLCRQEDNPMAGAVIAGRPASEDFASYLDRFSGNRWIKGVRQVIHVDTTPPGYCLRPQFIQGVRMLGERGLMFDICIRAEELADAGKLIDACSETQFILDHCGNANVQSPDLTGWRRDIAKVAGLGNVVCKISGIIASSVPGSWEPDNLAPIIDHCAQVFGPDRIMFASDWPVCTLVASLREWVTALRTIVASWPESNRRKLFHDNAAHIYGLT